MKAISIYGIVFGFFAAGISIWRWGSGFLYDNPFKLVVGLFIAISIMAWAYIIDWMAIKNLKIESIDHKIDSLVYSIKKRNK